MVLDTEHRDILARTGTWRGPRGPPVTLPLLLETRPALLPAPPPGAEGILLAGGQRREGVAQVTDGGPLVVLDLGSALRPGEEVGPGYHVQVPPEDPLPPSLADALEHVPVAARDREGLVEVVHAAAGRLAGEAPAGEGVEWVVAASMASLARRPDRLVDALLAARRRAGPARLLYVPGAATPMNLALLVYLGADVVDDVQCHLEASRGRLLRPELGHMAAAGGVDPVEAAGANLMALRGELELVRHAIGGSALRELVESRVRGEPWQVAALRRLDRGHRDLLRAHCPVHRDRPLLAVTRESLDRIEVTSWVERLLERYAPPPSARVLVLLPCSARKPYSRSRTHRRLADAMAAVPNRGAVHEVVLTSPLGAVPRELERTYPAAQYDIPVSGEWFPDEVDRIRRLCDHIRAAGGYDDVVSHMGEGLPFLEEDGDVAWTRRGGAGPLDGEALDRLASLVTEAAGRAPGVPRRARALEDVASVARFQFGPPAAQALLEEASVGGRGPAWRLRGPSGRQRAMLVPSRGLLSLTLEGAGQVAEAGAHRVWMDDFELKGDLFAVGVVGTDAGLRPEEEAVVIKGDRVEAVGVARMGGREMLEARRGVAVAVRHRRSSGGGGP